MTARIWTLGIALLALAPTAFGAPAEGITLSHFERLERFEISGRNDIGLQGAGSLGPIEMRFNVLGRSFDLQLEPNANLLEALEDRQGAVAAIPYRGRIAGVDGSWARIVIVNGMPAGLVFDGDSVYALELPGDAIVATNAPIAYRLADAVIAPGALSCATGAMPTTAEAVLEAIAAEVGTEVAEAAGAVSRINIGMVADYEATIDKGATLDAAIMTRMNNVDAIYSEQIGVEVYVDLIESFADPNDPFDANTAGDLLDDLRQYRSTSSAQQSRGLTHLYTGRDLEGSTVGIAYLDVLCRRSAAVGLSQISNSSVIDSLVAAHEIGHNFGAEHDGEAGTPCASESLNYIMAPRVNIANNTFSACSVSIMQASAARAACITALPTTDISVSFRDATATLLLGSAADIVIDVVNNGLNPAGNVAVDISLPTNVSVSGITNPSAGCVSGAGSVTCQLGEVAASSSTSIDLAISATSVGTGSFQASVVADADERLDNNQDSLSLTVDPAVDLVINALPSAQVTLDSSTTLTATFDNLATLDATGVTLSIALNAGLRANSASWAIGTCNVTAQQVDCEASRFDRGSSTSLTLNVTGVAEGTKNYTVTLASAEVDANAADNSLQGSVSVRAASGGGNSNDEGGGSISWLLLAILTTLSMRRAVQLRRRPC